MNKLKIGGILMFIIGCSSWFFVSGDPYTTLAGICAGLGSGMFLLGAETFQNLKRQ